ncbi:DNA recombination protein RmuC [Utexia brackfieldae]|uniref:DNA recombination protein RmuC n=1 Tax=Utexia brackfieldae TaxID=3074108 RepID=UPI00370D2DD5
MLTIGLTTLSIIGVVIIMILLMLSIVIIKTRLSASNQQLLFNLQLEQLEQEKRQWQSNHQTISSSLNQAQLQLTELSAQNAALTEKLNLLAVYQNQNQALEAELNQLRAHYTKQYAELSELKTRLQETKLSAEEKLQLLAQSELRLTEQFENLANRIFEHSGKRFEQQNRQSLDHLLTPLKEQLAGFKKQVQDSFGEEAKERHTLTHEIKNLQQLNLQMAKEAVNLTNALKGNNKTQGNWGEVILNRILESSGLREGYEYETQVNLNNEAGKRLQPDVIIRLPQSNDVIIDSKVTLIAYERYFNSDNEIEKEQALAEHLIAIRQHIKQLSHKDYHKLSGIKSLDYILMFIPVEPAFLTAIDRDPTLINEALKCNIMLVSPTTLLVALRTINNLWRYEYQNRHAQMIAERASKLYDKMRGFVEDMESLGLNLSRAHKAYEDSMTKLTKGRGNVIGQIEQFRELGIEIKKPISPKISQTACDEFQAQPDSGMLLAEQLPEQLSEQRLNPHSNESTNDERN